MSQTLNKLLNDALTSECSDETIKSLKKLLNLTWSALAPSEQIGLLKSEQFVDLAPSSRSLADEMISSIQRLEKRLALEHYCFFDQDLSGHYWHQEGDVSANSFNSKIDAIVSANDELHGEGSEKRLYWGSSEPPDELFSEVVEKEQTIMHRLIGYFKGWR